MINGGALLWVRADLRHRWRGIVFLALLAGIGFGIVLAALGGARRTDSAIDRAIDERRVADAVFQLNTPEAAKVVLEQPQVVEVATADMYLGQIEGVEFDAAALVVHGGWGTGGPGDAVLLDPAGLDDVASSEGFASLAISAAATSTAQLVAALTPLVEADIVGLSAYSYPHPPDRVANASSVGSVAWALAAFVGVLAIVATAHGIHTTMRRRRRDVAVLRALGFRPTDVRMSSAWHGACVAAVAIVAGIPLGIAAGRIAFRALTDDLGLEGGFVVPPVSLSIVAVTTAVAMQALTGVGGRRAARVSPAEVLRSE